MLSIALYLLAHAMLLSLHLSGGSFPRPLSAQEEKKYVERMLAAHMRTCQTAENGFDCDVQR